MTNIRRYYLPNSLVFVTSVTYNRMKIFDNSKNTELFWNTFYSVKELFPFEIMAYVILPDHFHCLMQLSEQFFDFSKIMKSFKWNYLLNYKKMHNFESSITLWQRRFWDHVIRPEIDLQTHMDYIHWNLVKHGYVDEPQKWTQSSKWIVRHPLAGAGGFLTYT